MFAKAIIANFTSTLFKTDTEITIKPCRNQQQFCAARMLSSGIAADSCQGDSGGPLACVNPASSETTVRLIIRISDSKKTFS